MVPEQVFHLIIIDLVWIFEAWVQVDGIKVALRAVINSDVVPVV
jgi:hypothetical protein